jgi:outer membrane protein TolC
VAVFAAAVAAAEVPADDPFRGAAELDRAVLLAAVRERNPTLAAARRAWEVATQRVESAGRLPDPRIEAALAPQSVGAEEVPFGYEIGVGQEFPWRGKRRLATASAAAAAAAAEAEAEAVLRELERTADELYAEYYLVARAQAINREHRELLEEFQRAATARYAAGREPLQAVLQAESELGDRLHDAVVLDARRRVIVARLNALLHRAPPARLPPPPARLPAPHPEAVLPGISWGLELFLLEAARGRPELAASGAAVEARQAELELARLARRPDLAPMTSYNSMWGDAEHRWMIGLELGVPRRAPIAAEVAAAEATVAAAEAERAALADRVAAEVATGYERVLEQYHVLELFEARLVPSAHDQIEAARAGFETGSASSLEVIEAERNLRSVELGYHQALADYHTRLAELTWSLGRAAEEREVRP